MLFVLGGQRLKIIEQLVELPELSPNGVNRGCVLKWGDRLSEPLPYL